MNSSKYKSVHCKTWTINQSVGHPQVDSPWTWSRKWWLRWTVQTWVPRKVRRTVFRNSDCVSPKRPNRLVCFVCFDEPWMHGIAWLVGAWPDCTCRTFAWVAPRKWAGKCTVRTAWPPTRSWTRAVASGSVWLSWWAAWCKCSCSRSPRTHARIGSVHCSIWCGISWTLYLSNWATNVLAPARRTWIWV